MRTWFLGIACASVNTLFVGVANAQVTPDNTLPNNSEVKVEGNINRIEGGTTAGSNLFHSFEKFGVPKGGEAHFNNAADIQNIISRVTGKSISDIDGLIKANGTANLFLINPNGIVFGENARLDIGGSFVGNTADSLKFTDGKEFSATNPQQASLLTVNVPLGLQYGANPGKIQVQGDGQGIRKSSEIIDTKSGLRVQPDKTLALVGGDVSLEGATLKTAGGRIELGSVKGEGLVNLTPTEKGFSFGYDAVETGGNIELSGQAAVDASGEGGGDIKVWGKNIKLTDGSRVEASTLGSENGGDLVVNAQESVEAIGRSKNGEFGSGLSASVGENSTGDAGDLKINTNTLLVKNGAGVSASTFGEGKGGNLTVDAQDVQLIRSKDGQFPSGLYTSARPNSTGDAGDLKINTNTLLVKDGAQVSASTRGEGKGGNLTVDAQDVQLIGKSKDGQGASGLYASVEPNSTGDAGNLKVNTNTLLVKDGAQVSASTRGEGKGGNLTVDAQDVQLIGRSKDGQFPSGLYASAGPNSTGDAGDLKINTNTLLVKDGAQVSAGTFGEGNGGNLSVNAQDVQVIGKSSGLFTQADSNSTGDAGDLMIDTDTLQVKDGGIVSAINLGTGTAGNVTINTTGKVLVKDGVGVSVGNLGTGIAGNLDITADFMQLDKGLILASTRSTNGGNINLNIADLLLMRNGSQISTTAVLEGAGGNGGNIDINGRDGFIIASREENNDITANAFEGNGGTVKIDAAGIFGMITRSREDLVNLLGTNDPKELDASKLTTNDITAISQQNPDLSGTVEIITPDTDTNSGLINVPTIPVETEVAQACADGSPLAQSRFEITGLNGLPPNPSEALTADAVLVDLVTLKPEDNKRSTATVSTKPTTSRPKKIVEATGFSRNKKGEIFLVADAYNGTNHSEWNKNTGCRSLNE